jgi:NAD-dependent DNA ligase
MPVGEWKWCSDVHIASVTESDEQKVKGMAHFFESMGCKGLKEGVCAKILRTGSELKTILYSGVEDLMCVEGFGEKMAEKTHQSFQCALENATLQKLMIGSCCFQGFGEAKIAAVLGGCGDQVVKFLRGEKIRDEVLLRCFNDAGIKSVAGKFLDGLKVFYEEWSGTHLLTTVTDRFSAPAQKISGGNTYVFSGFRMPELKAKLESEGHKVVDAVSSKTTAVIVKDSETSGSKVQKAKSLGISVVELSQFL